MSKIIVLEKNTRDQIAAGEVAERPALIVKELVENAIDAKATDIRIHLKDGGMTEIRVTDNGEGIEKDDIPKAFLRHATSKLMVIDDLNRLYTMGFRGEALASIAAVARVRIRTKARESDNGYECVLEGGEIGEITASPANQGTELVVGDLFYNTPARKKFMATPVRETREVSDIVGRIMIAHPHIRCELTNDAKRIIFTPGNSDMRTAIAGVYGQEPLKFLLPLDENPIFDGFIVHPNYSKPNRNYYHFYINHRYIQCDELNKALENAYKTLLPERRFPLCFININLSPDSYDINVHPNKLEAKFDGKSGIREQLYEVVNKTLQSGAKAYTTEIHEAAQARQAQTPFYETDEAEVPKIHQGLRLAGLPGAVEKKRLAAEHQNDPDYLAAELTNLHRGQHRTGEMTEKPKVSMKETASAEVVQSFFAAESPVAGILSGEEGKAFSEEALVFSNDFYTSLNILGQFSGTFIVAYNEEALYLIDQHAAHERLLFNKIKKNLEKTDSDVQALLIPQELELNYKQYNWVIENILVLHEMGFGLEVFGDTGFILREIPTWAQDIDAAAFLIEFADGWLDREKKITKEEVMERKIMSKACKRAVKANQHLTNADILYLFRELDQAEDAFTCPHGRPISVQFTMAEIRRKFLRT